MKVKDLFVLHQGNGLELMHIGTSEKSDVNFVSRTSQNNGVVAQVDYIDNLLPFPKGRITVALSGNVCSSFVQNKPFYTAFHVMVLEPKSELTLVEKLFYCMCIKMNAYKYSWGRQANKTLKDIELPDFVPEWVTNFSVKPIRTNLKQQVLPLRSSDSWGEFAVDGLFHISVSKDNNLFSSEYGVTPYIASSSENNGVTGYVDSEPSQKANTITIARNGSVGATFYQQKDYCASPDDIRILTPKFHMNVYIGLFLKTIIEQEKLKYGYGRKLGTARIRDVKIKLPVTSQNLPDWEYMEQYIKSLPYGDRI